MFYALNWSRRNAFTSSVLFAERKQFQSEISLGRLLNHSSVKRVKSDDQIFSSFKNRGIPPYFHNMLLDFLANIMQFRVYTFILTYCAALFYWTEIIQVLARQNGETEFFYSKKNRY